MASNTEQDLVLTFKCLWCKSTSGHQSPEIKL